jgi:hypothetical protein
MLRDTPLVPESVHRSTPPDVIPNRIGNPVPAARFHSVQWAIAKYNVIPLSLDGRGLG